MIYLSFLKTGNIFPNRLIFSYIGYIIHQIGLFCQSIKTEKLISSQYYGKIYPFTTRIEFTETGLVLIYSIDLKSNFTIAVVENIKSDHDIVKEAFITVNNNEIKCIERRSSISIYDEKSVIKDYHYYLTNSHNFDLINGKSIGFGFAFKFEDERFSLIHQLFSQGKISKKAFGIGDYITQSEYGDLYYGGIPEEDIQNKQFKGKCKVNPSYSTWSCKLISVDIGGNSYYTENEHMYFQTNSKFMIVPKKFLLFLNFTILKQFNGNCFFREYGNAIHTFKCINDIVYVLPNYTFVFDDYTFSIPMKEFFQLGNEISESILLSDTKITGDKDIWVFGNHFLSKYIKLFDYDDESITFYSDQYLIKPNKNKKIYNNNISQKLILRKICFT